MVIDPTLRGTAIFIHGQSRRIHDEARKRLQEMATSRNPAPTPDHTVSDTILDVKKRMPPNLPPDYGRLISGDSFRAENYVSNPAQVHMSPNSPTSSHHRIISNDPPRSLVAQSNMQIFKMPDEDTNPDYSRSVAVQYQEPHPLSYRPERGLSYPFSSSVPSQQQHEQLSRNAGMVSPSRQVNTTGTATGRRGNTQPSHLPSQNREDRAPLADRPSHRPLTRQRASQAPDYRGSDPFIQNLMASPGLQPMTSTAIAEPPSSRTLGPNLQPHPRMSVEDGLSVKRAKAMGKSAKFPGEDKLSHTMDAMMKDRDHVGPLLPFPEEALIDCRLFLSTTLRA